MKKTGLFLILGLFLISAQAQPTLCGYKDYFHFSADTPNQAHITYAKPNDQYLNVQITSSKSFEISDTPACVHGTALVVVDLDLSNGCLLRIKDGPMIRHPNVTASCHGKLQYVDMKYDGTGTHFYTLSFR